MHHSDTNVPYIANAPTQADALFQAIENNNITALNSIINDEECIKNDLINTARGTRKNLPPLYQAARKGNLEVVKILLDNGANPYLHLEYMYGETQLFSIFIKSHNELLTENIELKNQLKNKNTENEKLKQKSAERQGCKEANDVIDDEQGFECLNYKRERLEEKGPSPNEPMTTKKAKEQSPSPQGSTFTPGFSIMRVTSFRASEAPAEKSNENKRQQEESVLPAENPDSSIKRPRGKSKQL